MPESAATTSGGPSLEQILWRAMDRYQEGPALVDADAFAAHIEGVFQGDVPAETWVARFFDGAGAVHQAPSDLAEAIVRSTRDRLAVYEFDLRKLEYVIIEDEKKVVVVSDFGQFALPNDDVVGRAIEAAVIPQDASRGSALQRGGGEPKAYFVRQSGEVAAVDVKKVARSLEQLLVRQVSMPAVNKPGARLLPFAPSRRSLSEKREAQALRQDARTQRPVPAPPGQDRRDRTAAPPALFLLMPDGTLARPEMGSATRWQEMVGRYARSSATAVPLAQGQRLTLQAGGIVAIVQSAGSRGTVGERALFRSEALSAVRSDSAPVRTLGDGELQKALAAGAMAVPGFSRGGQFWVQPEGAFKPGALDQGGAGAIKSPPLVAQPVQLGEITGDPWADWALTGGGAFSPESMIALRGRTRHALRAALDRGEEPSIPPALAEKVRGARAKELQLSGAQVVGFRAPDGSRVAQRRTSAIRLAALDRPDSALRPIDLQLPGTGGPLAARSGAIPATALAALQMALEQTASASGYRLPVLRLSSASHALETGAGLRLSSHDPRRKSVRLAGPTSTSAGAGGQVARLLLSMPFPNGGEVHVGDDLSQALQACLGSALQPAAATFDRPISLPSGTGASSLPILLQRALGQAGDWTLGPGPQAPISIRELALPGPFDDGPLDPLALAPGRRPVNPGEEEIVIPMPLWAQMGRGQLSQTDQIMASPLVSTGYAPPMGVYRLVVPAGGPVDMASGAPAGTPGVADLFGPTGLELLARPGHSGVQASSLGGRQFIGRVAIDDGDTAVTRRGRIRVGAPLGAQIAPRGDFRSSETALSQGGSGPDASPVLVSTPAPTAGGVPDQPAGTFIDGSYKSSSAAQPSGDRPMASALASAMRFSNDVSARSSMPSQPSLGSAANGAPLAGSDAGLSAARAGGSPPFVTGLSPGLWSGNRRSDTSHYQSWSYAPGRGDLPRSAGGVHLGSLARPLHPSLPSALRFRYAGAPLWWSGATHSGALAFGGEVPASDGDSAPAGRALRSGLRAATSAASIWRSILVGSPQWAGGAQDLSGGMDAGHDVSASEMSSLSRRFDALTAASLVGAGGAAFSAGGGAAFVAVDGAGAAGTVSKAAARRARLDSIEMSIVAAIPPAPPALESMGSGPTGGDAPHARAKGHAHGGEGHHKEGEGAVSHSKIEGSVDAIAQRIYHRIRRRIQSDRERFGG